MLFTCLGLESFFRHRTDILPQKDSKGSSSLKESEDICIFVQLKWNMTLFNRPIKDTHINVTQTFAHMTCTIAQSTFLHLVRMWDVWILQNFRTKNHKKWPFKVSIRTLRSCFKGTCVPSLEKCAATQSATSTSRVVFWCQSVYGTSCLYMAGLVKARAWHVAFQVDVTSRSKTNVG